ncbi:MAG TPA: phage tail protein [Brevundimonas diminuta]|nr:phage tail protein [Brevundimonas diminuta]HRL23313.1 phage tail protein [Brevundimonas diminuta]
MTTKVSPEMLEEGVEIGGLIPVGGLTAFAGAVAPTGWLMAHGQSLARADYPKLFAAIGTAFGSASGTTFNVPDLRGRVAVGRDNMGGTPANRITSAVSGLAGENLGAGGGSQHLHQHGHSVVDPGHAHSTPLVASGPGDGSPTYDGASASYGVTAVNTTGVTIQSAGSGNAQNVQPSLILNWIIRAG